jgi:hypothetical protein
MTARVTKPGDAYPGTLDEALDYAFGEIRRVLLERHLKYGVKNIAMSEEAGIVVRVGDKWARLQNDPTDRDDETRDDTWGDIAGYAIIALLWRWGWWGLPMLEEASSRLCRDEQHASCQCPCHISEVEKA